MNKKYYLVFYANHSQLQFLLQYFMLPLSYVGKQDIIWTVVIWVLKRVLKFVSTQLNYNRHAIIKWYCSLKRWDWLNSSPPQKAILISSSSTSTNLFTNNGAILNRDALWIIQDKKLHDLNGWILSIAFLWSCVIKCGVIKCLIARWLLFTCLILLSLPHLLIHVEIFIISVKQSTLQAIQQANVRQHSCL